MTYIPGHVTNLSGHVTNLSGHVMQAAIFGLIGLNIIVAPKETIIYWLVVRNISYDAYLYFWATFRGKMGVATTRAYGLGPPNPTKKLAKQLFRYL